CAATIVTTGYAMDYW
nr:immunoglobulin heavy chain junction region [Mus musculus]